MENGFTPSPPEPGSPGPTASIHWPSIWQLGISIVALLGLWSASLLILVLGLIDQFSPQTSVDSTSMFLLAAGLGLFGFFLLPSIVYSLGRLRNRPVNLPSWFQLNTLWRMIFLFPFALLIGYLITTQTGLSWILLPPFHLMALGLPILFLFWIGSKGITNGNLQRLWGVFGAGLVLGPMIILLLEILALFGVLLMGLIFLTTQPENISELSALAEQLQYLDQDPFAALDLLEPYLFRPEVILTILFFAAGIVPIIEELFKPIGVWFLGAGATPAQGFVAGLLSGGGYALFENLALSSQSTDWVLAVTARAGTSLLHMVTAGLVGWATVYAWKKRNYLWIIVAYLSAVTIHGLWNGLTLLTLVNVLDSPDAAYLKPLSSLGSQAPFGLGALAILSLALLILFNRAYRDKDIPDSPGPPSLETQTEGTPPLTH